MRQTDLYRVDGLRVVSVTEALAAAGLNDWSHIPPEVLLKARLRGEEVHSWCEMVDKGELGISDSADESIDGYVRAYLRFKDEAGFEVVDSEKVVVSDMYRYAGTLDRIGYPHNLDNGWQQMILDIKCVAVVSQVTRLQLAAYAFADGDLFDHYSRASLQLRADGAYRLRTYTDRADLDDWLACLRVAHFKQRHRMTPQLED